MQDNSAIPTEAAHPPSMGKRFIRFFSAVLLLGFIFLILLPSMGYSFLTEFLFYLLTGWTIQLLEFFEMPQLVLSIILVVLTTALLFALFLKYYLHALLKNSKLNASYRLSVMVTIMIYANFLTGIGMIGTIHQMTWLLTSNKPLLTPGLFFFRIISLSNMVKTGSTVTEFDESESKPLAQTVNQNGKALHGWLTNLLPYMNYNNLYESIDHQAGWNEQANRALMKQRITEFINPAIPTEDFDPQTGYALSHYTANVRLFRRNEGYNSEIITDGKAQTILLGEAGSMFQPWGKPAHQRDPALGLNKHPFGFGSPFTGYVNIVYADGHGSALNDDIDPQVLKALSTPDGGDVIEFDF